ncbi:MAG: DEAD/DEAH box helicase [Proteobacteria bacterium]|nr:DEAD/DEAH box helicase [Pseudomonadota bacterium]
MPATPATRTKSRTASGALAAGTRVSVRGEEWVVERCLPVPTGGYAVHVHGLTELVQHQKAIFLTALDRVEPLRPEDTTLVVDDSPEYRQTRLFLETLLRRTPPTDAAIHLGHRGAIEVMPYQLRPARRALSGLRPRILIADGVGLGKTIEVGILLSELIKRGRGRRILVVAIKSLLAQLQEELWNRFTIPLVRLDSLGIQRVQAQIPCNRNPFSHYDRVIISVDTLKNNARYRAWLEQTRWDAVVVDECHNVANRGSQRERLARLLAATCDSLILTSATPHNGRPESFANLMRMLDPTAVADDQDFTYQDVKHLFIRRFKKNIEGEASESFSERRIIRHHCQASQTEEKAFTALRALRLHNLGRKRHGPDRLFPWVLVKGFLSSPQACIETIDERLKRIDKELSAPEPHPYADVLADDANTLRELRAVIEVCIPDIAKLARLIEQLRKIGFDGTAVSPRVIVFSERIKTLETLETTLRDEFGIRADSPLVQVFHASIGDKEQQDIVDSFGKADAEVRLLLASDVASEGVNLHYYCNQLFHYDVPWSLIRLEQRMGRIDRFGQAKTPHLHYLLTVTDARGADQIVIKRLIEKEEEVYRQLGEAGVVLGLYDADAEDEHITTRLAEGAEPAEIIRDQLPEPKAVATADGNASLGINLLDLLAEADQEDASASEPITVATAHTRTLFARDYDFVCAALHYLHNGQLADSELQWESNDDRQAITLWAPESFSRWREPFLPAEAVPAENQPYRLVAERDTLFAAMARARERQGQWPAWHLLWEHHPIVDWLLDSLAVAYARNEAPCLRALRLGSQRAIYVLQTILSNQSGTPIHSAWFGLPIHLREGTPTWEQPMELDQALSTSGLADGLTNPGKPPDYMSQLQTLVPDVIERARAHIATLHKEALTAIRKDVRDATRRVARWRTETLQLLDAREASAAAENRGSVPTPLAKRLSDQRRNVERRTADHAGWLGSLLGHGEAYVRLCAVLVGEG